MQPHHLSFPINFNSRCTLCGLCLILMHWPSMFTDFNNSPRCLRSVENLDLSHNELTHLPDYFLASLRFLRELRVTWNGIATVGERSLAGLMSLQKLDLSGNKLSVLPPDWLNDSPSLSELRLADNSLAVLGPGIFSGKFLFFISVIRSFYLVF